MEVYFFTILEGVSPGSRVSAGLVSSEALAFLRLQMAAFSCAFIGSSLCICALISYKDTSHIGLWPILTPHFILITFLKTVSPNTVTFWGAVGLGLKHMNLAGRHNSAHDNDLTMDYLLWILRKKILFWFQSPYYEQKLKSLYTCFFV